MRRLFVVIMLSTLLTSPILACGPAPNSPHNLPIWPPGAAIDQLLPNATLADAEMKNIKALRAKIAKLGVKHNLQRARSIEEEAMKLLGYGQVWTPGLCAPPTFRWEKLKVDVSAMTVDPKAMVVTRQ